MSFTPTVQQQAIVDAFAARDGDVVITAGAGSGKTSTLKLLPNADRSRRGLYLAYNSAIAKEAAATFPSSVMCKTAHSLAFGAVGREFAHRLQAPRMPARETARLLRINEPLRVSPEKVLAPTQLANVVMRTIERFCQSGDPRITAYHVPRDVPGADDSAARTVLAQMIVPIAQRSWNDDLTKTDGRLKFTHDCQPPGTLVRRVTCGMPTEWEDVPIEQVREGDMVVSYDRKTRRGYVRRQGRRVNRVGGRYYVGDLVTATTTRGRSSSYTAEHRCIVRLDVDLAEGNHIVYMMRRGLDYRIGTTTWRTKSQGNANGLRRRAESQRADAAWVLSVHATAEDALLHEALVSHEFGVPTWQFRSPNERMPLDQFWSKVGNNAGRAAQVAVAHGRSIEHPLWEKQDCAADGWSGKSRRPVVVRACNLLDGMLALEPDEMTPGPKGELLAHDGYNGWAPITVTRSPYDGPVYNLDVDVDHTYVADGIVTRNCYLKMWQLSDPMLSFDYVMLDEAQDTNGVVAAVFDKQIHTQRVAVGDANQAIYGWRGAMDYMTAMTAKYRLALTQSFRFGQVIADEANKWLTVIDSDLRITGTGTSLVQSVPTPHAILCRTNAEAVASLICAHDNCQAAALVGGGRDLAWFADAADQLRTSGWTSHPELMSFSSWGEVQDYVENDHGGDDFKVAVKLIETYGTDGVKSAIDRSVDEKHADVVISTAHKAKGREWATVRIANDFTEPRARDGVPGLVDRAEAMLAYVAVTRARKVLDREGLAWIDNYLDPEHVGLFDLIDDDSLLAGFDTPAPVVAPASPTVVTLTAPAPPRYRVLAVDGNPLSEWTESYEAACKLLRGHPDADRLDTSTAATAA